MKNRKQDKEKNEKKILNPERKKQANQILERKKE